MSAGVASFSPALANCGDEGALLALKQRVRDQALDRPGIYRMFSPEGEVLYVGKSKQIKSRLLSYFRCSYPEEKGARLIREAQTIEWDYVPSEFAALLAELRQIKRFRPRFNHAMKRDARHYAFIKLVGGKAPRLQVVRGGTYEEGATYYGPYVGAASMEEAIRELNDLLGLRDCALDRRMFFSDQQELFNLGERTPGCVRYEIGKCLGPCIGACSSREYLASIKRARAFLDGTDEEPLDRLRSEMHECSERMEYERAGSLRDKLERLELLHSQFQRLRFAAETLSFLYAVPGVGGDDKIYVIRRGQVRAECALPQTPEDTRVFMDLSESIYSRPVHNGSAIPTHEIDELLLLSFWFKQNPRELQRTVAPSEMKPRGLARSLKKLISAA